MKIRGSNKKEKKGLDFTEVEKKEKKHKDKRQKDRKVKDNKRSKQVEELTSTNVEEMDIKHEVQNLAKSVGSFKPIIIVPDYITLKGCKVVKRDTTRATLDTTGSTLAGLDDVKLNIEEQQEEVGNLLNILEGNMPAESKPSIEEQVEQIEREQQEQYREEQEEYREEQEESREEEVIKPMTAEESIVETEDFKFDLSALGDLAKGEVQEQVQVQEEKQEEQYKDEYVYPLEEEPKVSQEDIQKIVEEKLQQPIQEEEYEDEEVEEEEEEEYQEPPKKKVKFVEVDDIQTTSIKEELGDE